MLGVHCTNLLGVHFTNLILNKTSKNEKNAGLHSQPSVPAIKNIFVRLVSKLEKVVQITNQTETCTISNLVPPAQRLAIYRRYNLDV